VPVGTTRPFFSVIIPSYENAELLTRALESVLTQAPGPDEMQIHVVDDRSPNVDIAGLVERVGRGRVSFSRNAENVGPPANFTNCIRASTGYWVHILHQDDRVLPGFYDTFRHRLEESECVMAIGRHVVVDDSDVVVAIPPELAAEGGLVIDAQFTLATLHPVHSSAIVVARAAYEQIGGFSTDLVYATDRVMWARLAAIGSVEYLPEPSVRCLYHAGSDSSRLQQSMTYVKDIATAVDEMARAFTDAATRRRVRREGRSELADHVLSAGIAHAAAGRWHLAISSAIRALRLSPSWSTGMATAKVVASATTGVLRRSSRHGG